MEKNVMATTGIMRHIDDLGRVVIPKEIRRTMGIVEGEELEIFTDGNGSILLRKAGTANYVPDLELKPEPEKIAYTFENIYEDNYRVVTITREQEKLLNWLCGNGYLGEDVNISRGYPDSDDLT